jgi:dTDP-4-dehydrorhamnose reductase
MAERGVQAVTSKALVVRTAAFFGPTDSHNVVTTGLRSLRAGREVPAAHDQIISPTYVPDLADAVLDLLVDGESGVWHVTNRGNLSWYSLLRLAAERVGAPTATLQAVSTLEMGLVAPRPACAALRSERGELAPTLEDALDRYVATTRPDLGGTSQYS